MSGDQGLQARARAEEVVEGVWPKKYKTFNGGVIDRLTLVDRIVALAEDSAQRAQQEERRKTWQEASAVARAAWLGGADMVALADSFYERSRTASPPAQAQAVDGELPEWDRPHRYRGHTGDPRDCTAYRQCHAGACFRAEDHPIHAAPPAAPETEKPPTNTHCVLCMEPVEAGPQTALVHKPCAFKMEVDRVVGPSFTTEHEYASSVPARGDGWPCVHCLGVKDHPIHGVPGPTQVAPPEPPRVLKLCLRHAYCIGDGSGTVRDESQDCPNWLPVPAQVARVSPEPVCPNCGETGHTEPVVCVPCSIAGGAHRNVEHCPPACAADPKEGE